MKLFTTLLLFSGVLLISADDSSSDEGQVVLVACDEQPNTEPAHCQSSTQPSCENPNPQIKLADCRYMCICKSGYLLNENNQCVPYDECPQPFDTECKRSDGNSEYKECQSSTRATCANPEPQAITEDCVNGCFCQNGYLFDEQTGKCVLQQECTPIQ